MIDEMVAYYEGYGMGLSSSFQMMTEMVNYYAKYHIDQLCHHSTYEDIGRRLYTEYPVIGRKGTHPWTQLTGNLSTRMRTRRFVFVTISYLSCNEMDVALRSARTYCCYPARFAAKNRKMKEDFNFKFDAKALELTRKLQQSDLPSEDVQRALQELRQLGHARPRDTAAEELGGDNDPGPCLMSPRMGKHAKIVSPPSFTDSATRLTDDDYDQYMCDIRKELKKKDCNLDFISQVMQVPTKNNSTFLLLVVVA